MLRSGGLCPPDRRTQHSPVGHHVQHGPQRGGLVQHPREPPVELIAHKAQEVGGHEVDGALERNRKRVQCRRHAGIACKTHPGGGGDGTAGAAEGGTPLHYGARREPQQRVLRAARTSCSVPAYQSGWGRRRTRWRAAQRSPWRRLLRQPAVAGPPLPRVRQCWASGLAAGPEGEAGLAA